jgi:lysophospholipase L1-like esterase
VRRGTPNDENRSAFFHFFEYYGFPPFRRALKARWRARLRRAAKPVILSFHQESTAMRRIGVIAFLLFLLVVAAPPAAEPTSGFFFQKGDRIVFLGDSITEQYQYSSVIELYLTTRFPQWNLTFINAGIGGDTASGGAGRFPNHVLAEKPTAVTINFGMNDAGYGAFNPNSQKNYVAKTEQMVDMAKKAGVRVALLSPNAVDRRVQERFKLYLETQKEFYAPLKDIASKYGMAFVDQYAVTRAGLEKMEADEAIKVKPFGDGFHTSSPGGLFMAHAILTGLKAPPAVSDVTIDAKASKATASGCKVEKLQAAESSVTFQRTDEALPIPVQMDWETLLPYVNQLKDLNWYGLKVTGLAAGKYALKIDGKEVATYSAEQLAAGVNLGNLTSGPIYDQSAKVWAAINDKNKLVHARFRGVVMFDAGKLPDWLADLNDTIKERKPKELAKRTEQIAERQAEVYKLAQPVPHTFELTAVK